MLTNSIFEYNGRVVASNVQSAKIFLLKVWSILFVLWTCKVPKQIVKVWRNFNRQPWRKCHDSLPVKQSKCQQSNIIKLEPKRVIKEWKLFLTYTFKNFGIKYCRYYVKITWIKFSIKILLMKPELIKLAGKFWPQHCTEESLQSFFNRRDQLHAQHGCYYVGIE